MTERLKTTDGLPNDVRVPGYRRDDHGAGIVHIGLGAFHRAHQAAYTDDALAAAGGDWRITGVSLRSDAPAQELGPQNGLYTLIERDASGSRARVIGALAAAHCLRTDRDAVTAALLSDATRIVTITVTEKGYGLDRASGGVDPAHPAIAHDLDKPSRPQGLAGLLVWALGQRRRLGRKPFTVLCCDNLPENGKVLRGLLVDFARRAVPDLADHIAEDVAFPSTMVDRITPAATQSTRDLAEDLTGRRDAAAIETEGFHQWVIEDHFPTGRPGWEAGGAIFTTDVRPYEEMKLRMLNGAHSMLAYAGFAAGHRYVRDVMADPALSRLVTRHLRAASATFTPLEGVDFAAYADQLAERFRNPHLAHETFQIAMDGSEKMPQRVFSAIPDARAGGGDLRAFAFATAAWLRHLSQSTHDCAPYELRDPRAGDLSDMAQGKPASAIIAAIRASALVSRQVARDDGFWDEVNPILHDMLTRPMTDVIGAEAA
ncbi:mannitol dehydrogenase family protein [Thalassococcus sp. BH17M4-6]|uniref:mannitol dehydrogenase family protein n=1 Tax=Thalassococcus sp. BH17M4-6 TaxID=3413148 RepID=UPI003BC180A2